MLVPAYQIQVDAFIPQQWVSDPFGYVYNGNSRKTPLDGSFTTGTSTFTKSGQYKMEHGEKKVTWGKKVTGIFWLC
jgi:hypothetical protein